jgi:hypothetical protein
MKGVKGGFFLWLLALFPTLAQAEVPVQGDFLAQRACPAYASKNKQTNPGLITLQVGQSYPVVARNNPVGNWFRVRVAEADPALRWVEKSCGTVKNAPGSTAGFAPFFDLADSGPLDPTPRPPVLSAFDRAVLEVCGSWGSVPSPKAFRRMLEADFPEVLVAVKEAVAGSLSPEGDSDFSEALTKAWFQEQGFAHIFCGEPGAETLGGFHYVGRYIQAQDAGWAGQVGAEICRRTEIKPPIYTQGVAYQIPGTAGQGLACPKGYDAQLTARDILILGSKALRLARMTAADERDHACLMPMPQRQVGAFVFVMRNNSIRTLYPDATPSRRNDPCMAINTYP